MATGACGSFLDMNTGAVNYFGRVYMCQSQGRNRSEPDIRFTSDPHHVHIAFTSRSHRVHITFTPRSHHVHTTFTSRSHHVHITFTSRSHR
eukprot:1417452-Lingulodinium_polyedra.AAC.1